MQQLSTCAVCGSEQIVFGYDAKTNRRPADAARWNVYTCRQCSHGFMNPQPSWDARVRHQLSQVVDLYSDKPLGCHYSNGI